MAISTGGARDRSPPSRLQVGFEPSGQLICGDRSDNQISASGLRRVSLDLREGLASARNPSETHRRHWGPWCGLIGPGTNALEWMRECKNWLEQ
jgi:hypothetical protein